MEVYFVLIAYVFLLRTLFIRVESDSQKKLFLAFSIIPIILLMTLRSQKTAVVYDTESYYDFYSLAAKSTFQELMKGTRFGIGYALLNFSFSKIFPNPRVIFFLEALICNVAISYFIYKNSENVFLSVIFYISLGTMTFIFTAFRQAIAMSICLIAVEAIKDRKLVPFLLLISLAATFHVTAIVFLPMYWLSRNPISMKNILVVAIVVFFAFKAIGMVAQIANLLFSVNYDAGLGVSLMNGLVQILIYLAAIFLMYVLRKKNMSTLFFNMVLWGFGIFILRTVLLSAERISFYFGTALFIALPTVVMRFWKNERVIVKTLVALLAVVLFIYRMKYLEIGNYRFFWQAG
jgi:hypothetical protein